MGLFAALLNGFCGIWYGTYILNYNPGWELAIFPIWNIINGFVLIGNVREDIDFGEKTISDENVSFRKLLVGTILVTIIFLSCQLYFKLVWAATFSICMVWVSNLNKAVNKTLLKLEISIR